MDKFFQVIPKGKILDNNKYSILGKRIKFELEEVNPCLGVNLMLFLGVVLEISFPLSSSIIP